MVKIIDKIRAREAARKTYFSLEFFPPRTEPGVVNLIERVSRFQETGPEFVDITWGAGGSTAELTLELAMTFQNELGVETQMHLTCTNMPRERVDEALKTAHDSGIQNLLCLRGDPPAGQVKWEATEGGFSGAIDLVRYVRANYGDYFCIGVAGYPEGHPDGDYESDLQFLKAKVDAGADLVVTQLFYDADVFLRFVQDCRSIGITVPILPGIMPIQSYNGFCRMTEFCKTRVPDSLREAIAEVQHDDEAVKRFGVAQCVEMCQRLIDAGVYGLHFYTMNLEPTVRQILSRLDLLENSGSRPRLPWAGSSAPSRADEAVRPIFWAKRVKSYLSRTSHWDDFPNGRWGDIRSPAFDSGATDYHQHAPISRKQHLVSRIGEVASLPDVYRAFAAYCRGELPALPWCDFPLAPESNAIRADLVLLNRTGFLTTNSQPRCDSVESSDSVFGWGPADGYVYQKAYVEFFVEPKLLQMLLELLPRYRSLQLLASNHDGSVTHDTAKSKTPTAVTWGVFPGHEIIQPTVVDPLAFGVWRNEAFLLWKEWASCYPSDSTSVATLQRCHDEMLLVSVVDNDFRRGDIFAPFREIASLL